MSETVIRVENLSKRYIIGHQRNRHDGLRHRIEDTLRNPFRWLQRRAQERQAEHEDFWALKDISFEVKQGEVVGVIGRNGAGKSTLLKILSRITEPTSGRIRIKGRVASLLEVGTGFHPELTGRENIFLNGAILGMSKVEIKRKFDEIVAFSEIEKFLDTPVKRYSSGMYVRLAFAVAAHLEPEILIVDEVLAVGDLNFQKKCLGKMRSVSKQEGRTVLFVSHNMGSIIQLSNRGVLLEKGRVVTSGDISSVVKTYLSSGKHEAVWISSKDPQVLRAEKKLFFTKIEFRDVNGLAANEFEVGKPFTLNLEYEVPRALKPVEVAIRVLTTEGNPVLTSFLSDYHPETMRVEKRGVYRAVIKFPEMFLMPGNYMVNVAAHAGVGEIFDLLPAILSFTILDTGTSYTKYQHNHLMGVVISSLPWREEEVKGHPSIFGDPSPAPISQGSGA